MHPHVEKWFAAVRHLTGLGILRPSAAPHKRFRVGKTPVPAISPANGCFFTWVSVGHFQWTGRMTANQKFAPWKCRFGIDCAARKELSDSVLGSKHGFSRSQGPLAMC